MTTEEKDRIIAELRKENEELSDDNNRMADSLTSIEEAIGVKAMDALIALGEKEALAAVRPRRQA